MAVEMKYKDYIEQGFDIVKANLVPSLIFGLLCALPGVGGTLRERLHRNHSIR